MKRRTKELQKLKGVGVTLSRRFVEAGYDTFAKIAAAGEEGLKKIQGLTPGMIQSILAQTGVMIEEAQKCKSEKVVELKQKTDSLKMQVQNIALSVRDRFKDEVAGKIGRKLEKDIGKIISSLDKVEGELETKGKKTGKVLAKAEKRLANLADANLKRVDTGLKKARKSLKRVYA